MHEVDILLTFPPKFLLISKFWGGIDNWERGLMGIVVGGHK